MPKALKIKSLERVRIIHSCLTNHSQYVAEKETAKVLRGLLMSLTGNSESELAERLDSYCKQVNGEKFTPQERSSMLSAIRDGAKIDFFDEPNGTTSIEEAMKKDPTAYMTYVPRLPEFETIDFEFEPEQVDDESKWKDEDKTEFENDGFEFKPEHITKKTKWTTKDNENLASIFGEPDENSNGDILSDENSDPERMRCPVNEELVSIDGAGRSEVVDGRSVILPPDILK